MAYLVLVHLLNDEEEEYEVSDADHALQILTHLIHKYDAAQIQFWQIQPVHG